MALLFFLGIAAIILVPVLIVIYYYNSIILASNRIQNAWGQIDVQLKKRADLVPNLIETVKGYAKHEKTIFEDVTKARERMLGAGNPQAKMKESNKFAAALKTIFAIAENYPQLKASENFKLLQEQLEGIESKIAYSRQFYNDEVLRYNNSISTVPGIWFAKMMNRKEQKEYLEIPAEEREVVKVKF